MFSLKSKFGNCKVCKKKNLPWVFDAKILPLGSLFSITRQSLVKLNNDSQDRFFYLHLTPMKDSYMKVSDSIYLRNLMIQFILFVLFHLIRIFTQKCSQGVGLVGYLQLKKINGPHHEKTCLCHMRTTKMQISLQCTSAQSDQRLCCFLPSIIPILAKSKFSSL